ncbi:MAG: DMT family transporter [Sphingomonadales bacterium]|nr:DMT family transporter [Sphingomonadales bacterium]
MQRGSGTLLVLTAGVLWSAQPLIVRHIGPASAWAILFWRSAGMLPVVVAFLAWRTRASPLPALRNAGLAGVLGGLGLVAAMGGAILAYKTTSIANAAFLYAASPFIAAVLARVLLHERVVPATVLAIALALVGIAVMVGDGLAAGAWIGNLAGLVSATGFAAFTVALRWHHTQDSLPTSVLGSGFTMLTAAAISARAGTPLVMALPAIAWCLAMGAGTLAGGMILYTLGSRTVPSAELALLSNIEVMLGPVWVWLVLGETARPATLAGGAVLLVAILFNAAMTARHPAPA